MTYPRYRCHKDVGALKIRHVDRIKIKTGESFQLDGAMIIPAEEGYAAFEVSEEYVQKHNPKPGGYYVVYKDGYQSFSPAAAFESGYHPIGKSSVELNVDLGSLLICSCGYALLPTEKEHVFLHPILNPVNEKPIECEHAGKKYRVPQVPVYLEEAE